MDATFMECLGYYSDAQLCCEVVSIGLFRTGWDVGFSGKQR
jgi:hypothetical protein